MTGRIVKYSEPVPFHKALPGAKSIVLWKRVDDDGVPEARLAKPKNPTKPKVRNARNVAIDDEIGEAADANKGTTMVDYGNDISRGPYHSMLDKMARARQAITGESYAKAFTETYTDPANAAIRDGAQPDHLAKGHDAIHGTRLSLIPVAKAAPAYDPLRKAAEIAEQFGPAHAKLHSMAVDHARARSGMSYEQAYSHLYSRMENAPLREKIKTEHLRASMAAVQDQGELGKAAAPMDEVQDYVSPGSASDELDRLIITRMKNDPKLSYHQAFTREYTHPDNRPLKSRVDAESVLHAQRLAPAPASPAYRGG
jgi:hypothetical protein